MRAIIERYGCIGCGLCSDTCPEVFRMDEEGLAVVCINPLPSDAVEATRHAVEKCPVSVITLHEK